MRGLALALCLVLTGCVTTGGGVVVDTPIPVACRAVEPERPAMPLEALRPGASLDLIVKSAQAESLIREGYESRLLAALRSCTAPLKTGP